jgi:hypothetical protein
MLFKGSNNLVQIYRSFVITGNYGRQSFSKYGISYYRFTAADVNIHSQIAKYGIDILIVRTEMMKFKMFREKVNMDFYFVGITF